MKKCILSSLVMMIFCATTIISSALNSTEAKDIVLKNIDSLRYNIETSKDKYQLTNQDDLKNDLNLGEPRKCYVVDFKYVQAVKEGKGSLSSDKLFVTNDNYVVPVYVGKKHIGAAFVNKVGDKWDFVESATDNLSENYIKELKQIFKNDFGDENFKIDDVDNKYIEDGSIGLQGIFTSKNKKAYFRPITDNQAFGYKRNDKVELRDLFEKLKAVPINQEMVGGFDTNSTSSYNYYLVSTGVFVLIMATIIIIKRRKLQKI